MSIPSDYSFKYPYFPTEDCVESSPYEDDTDSEESGGAPIATSSHLPARTEKARREERHITLSAVISLAKEYNISHNRSSDCLNWDNLNQTMMFIGKEDFMPYLKGKYKVLFVNFNRNLDNCPGIRKKFEATKTLLSEKIGGDIEIVASKLFGEHSLSKKRRHDQVAEAPDLVSSDGDSTCDALLKDDEFWKAFEECFGSHDIPPAPSLAVTQIIELDNCPITIGALITLVNEFKGPDAPYWRTDWRKVHQIMKKVLANDSLWQVSEDFKRNWSNNLRKLLQDPITKAEIEKEKIRLLSIFGKDIPDLSCK